MPEGSEGTKGLRVINSVDPYVLKFNYNLIVYMTCEICSDNDSVKGNNHYSNLHSY